MRTTHAVCVLSLIACSSDDSTSASGGGASSEAGAESIANPRTVVGTGTPESCTADAFVAAVAKGGVITFDCGAAIRRTAGIRPACPVTATSRSRRGFTVQNITLKTIR